MNRKNNLHLVMLLIGKTDFLMGMLNHDHCAFYAFVQVNFSCINYPFFSNNVLRFVLNANVPLLRSNDS